jgi:Major Facilitator Superfamily
MIANLQYGWTLFTIPISQTHGWSLASIQVAFTLFVLFETWLVPVEGYLVDRFGPRIVVLWVGALRGVQIDIDASMLSIRFPMEVGLVAMLPKRCAHCCHGSCKRPTKPGARPSRKMSEPGGTRWRSALSSLRLPSTRNA